MLTKKRTKQLQAEIHAAIEENPGISSEELFREMFPDHVSQYDFDQNFQYVRSGHYDVDQQEDRVKSAKKKTAKTSKPGSRAGRSRRKSQAKEVESQDD